MGKGPHDDREVRLGYGLKSAEALVALMAGVRLREVRFTEVEDGWRAMFKGDLKGKPVVAYAYHDTYAAVLMFSITSLDLGRLSWHHDEYPPKRYGNPPIPLRF